MSSSSFESLLKSISMILEASVDVDLTKTSSAKTKLVQATNSCKDDLQILKRDSLHLRGGELSVKDQDAMIEALESLVTQKRRTMSRFASDVSKQSLEEGVKMNVDSTASTPVNR